MDSSPPSSSLLRKWPAERTKGSRQQSRANSSLCRTVLPDANRHSGRVPVDRDTPRQQPTQSTRVDGEADQRISPGAYSSSSVTLLPCAARTHCSFLHLQIKSLSTACPVLHNAPGSSVAVSWHSTNSQANRGVPYVLFRTAPHHQYYILGKRH